jgi:hypothetical protein
VIAAHVEDLDTLMRKEEGEGEGGGEGDGVTLGAGGVMEEKGGAGGGGEGGNVRQGQRDQVTPL